MKRGEGTIAICKLEGGVCEMGIPICEIFSKSEHIY